ncbi:MAG: glycolate oxidase subunit GlcF [Pigmentiphaga sp.]|nr:glycolate oxidase subunit GlcF [Pigmentiphaga sp.]
MQTDLAPQYRDTAEGRAAEAILRKCVHCGFCTATCPTYQLLGDELDGPRGRIYLIKQVLEGHTPGRATQIHLDRCLTCRNCETTCPSGVEYGALLEIGRELVERQVKRPVGERLARGALRHGLTSPAFGPAVKLGQAVRRWLPASLAQKLPAAPPRTMPRQAASESFSEPPASTAPVAPGAAAAPPVSGAAPEGHGTAAAPIARAPEPTPEAPGAAAALSPPAGVAAATRQVWMLDGCVQPTLAPAINTATRRVLERAGITAHSAPAAGCCGAIALHLADTEGALRAMRRNIDAWWPAIDSGEVEGLVMNASGCGVTVKDYGRLLAHDPRYAERSRRISELTRDLAEWLPELCQRLPTAPLQGRRLVVQAPCTLQHGQRLPHALEAGLRSLGATVRGARQEAHLCCGSAGTYSVLQPELSQALRDRKLAGLAAEPDETIVSANIGCIQHLGATSKQPVRHWVEVLDEALEASPA